MPSGMAGGGDKMYHVAYDRLDNETGCVIAYDVTVSTIDELWRNFNAYCADPDCSHWRGDYPDEYPDEV